MKQSKKDALTDLAQALAQDVMTELQAQSASTPALEDGQVVNSHGEVINLAHHSKKAEK